MKYIKKKTIVEATQWTGKNLEEIKAMTNIEKNKPYKHTHNNILIVKTDRGDELVYMHDWVCVGLYGELFPCSNYIFEQVFEPYVEEKK